MFIVLLSFADKSRAPAFMDSHMQWLRRGFDDGVFLLSGTLPNRGGGIFAAGTTLPELQRRVNDDPFVAEKVVTAEIIELNPSKAEPRLQFLLPAAGKP